MKKSLIILTALVGFASPAFAKLPFVGERLFAFDGGQIEYTIAITQAGATTITAYSHHTDPQVEYKGKYQTYMPISQNGKITGYYQIKDEKIHYLDRNKKPVAECGRGADACVADLESL